MSNNQTDKAKKTDNKENQESLHHLPQVVRKVYHYYYVNIFRTCFLKK